MLRRARLAEQLVVFALLAFPSSAQSAPLPTPRATNSHGPEGPWQAFRLWFGSSKQRLDSFPGSPDSAVLLEEDFCDTYEECYTSKEGLYSLDSSTAQRQDCFQGTRVIANAKGTPTRSFDLAIQSRSDSTTRKETWDREWTSLPLSSEDSAKSSASQLTSSPSSPDAPAASASSLGTLKTAPSSSPSNGIIHLSGLDIGAISVGIVLSGLGLAGIAILVVRSCRGRIKKQLSSCPHGRGGFCTCGRFSKDLPSLPSNAHLDGRILATKDAPGPPTRHHHLGNAAINPWITQRAELPGEQSFYAELEGSMAHELCGDVPAVELPSVRHSQLPPALLQQGGVAYVYQLGVPSAQGQRQQQRAGRIGSTN